MNRTVLLLTTLLGTAYAATQAPLSLTLVQDLIVRVQKDGKVTEQRLDMPKSIKPGDLLLEEVTARNTTRGVLRGAAINLPVPRGTTYAGDATRNAAVTTLFTVDGKTFAEAPLKRKVTVTENGKSVQKEVTVQPNEYTGVRWVVGAIKPDESLKLSFRVTVK
ncbi:hypothetical protein [Deinococcus ficus]|uniref:DUF11 domain-containing protein n=1 Tax=Deinococcus ficus TaxID=317577 RepID=A0A221T1G3_9DEIO|nr:hypothetical protein [Deinococcus ficus]ASN82748.1 hypothetical protein DFI_16455 [Deinococcus ficus]